ncbi:PadR family transcriptional regulator [Paenibacillus mendelii]|uniref:PadR family transcriptional regulator n=1 Tax=Paenibacillus mendelii TaxID=206163 RepID=A0ABV6J1R3_9BACL|nr:PadR family transcriptional regulator [Paenibacillus mendelii]MCQ6562750.1 PadR family transcriptional regulator [Paenibacillus mendelii]
MSTARLLVLGIILRRGITHGYGVYQELTSWRAETWTNIKPGSIYHALEKLESQGMIKADDSGDRVKRGPSRTEYTLTIQGENEFITLLESALKSNDFQVYAAGIAFMEMLPRHHVISLFDERLVSLRGILTFLRSLPTESLPSNPSKHPELVGMWVGYFEYAIEATQKLRQSLISGNYIFKNEESELEGVDHD